MTIYLPLHFEQSDPVEVAETIRAFPLATIVTQTAGGIVANHIPLMLDEGLGLLLGHVARNNAVWNASDNSKEALVMFQTPDVYITPTWYATKQESHEVVPTWNYAVVHMYGDVTFHDDEKWVRGVVGKLTRMMEADRENPWSMAQAPRDYLKSQLSNIVGVEIRITRTIAKWKTSQNRSVADRVGVVSGLRESDSSSDRWIAEAVERTLS